MLPFDQNIKLSMDDLPNKDLAFVAEMCGLEVATQLMLRLQGVTIRVPRNAMKKVVAKYICEHYDGGNQKHLAVQCNVSVRHVYNVLQASGRIAPRSHKDVKEEPSRTA